jgi:hypothetical protein
MIGAAEPIHVGNIDGIAPHIFERAVVAAVAADFSVAMKLAAHQVERLAKIIDFPLAAALHFSPFFGRGFGGMRIGDGHFGSSVQRKSKIRWGDFQSADEDVVIERIVIRGQRIIAARPPDDMAILSMVGRVRNHQAAFRMSGDGWRIVKQVVRVRQNDWAGPFFAIVIRGIIDPNRP